MDGQPPSDTPTGELPRVRPSGLNAGDTVAYGQRYVVMHDIARGALSDVFLAWDTRLQRRVAMKILRDEFLDHPAIRQAFFEEARLYAELSHPTILSIHDVSPDASPGTGTTPAPAWMVLDHIDGVTLALALRARRHAEESGSSALRPSAVVALLEELLAALSYAHERGVTHGDISPENIMIARDGTLRVVDLGLAVSATRHTGQRRGTVHFLAPEVTRGYSPGPRSDVYAVGALAFALLAGRPPYMGVSSTQIAGAHVTEPIPDLCALAPTTPTWLCEVVGAALRKRPDERYADASAMLSALRVANMAEKMHDPITPSSREHLLTLVRGADDAFGPPLRDAASALSNLRRFAVIRDHEGASV